MTPLDDNALNRPPLPFFYILIKKLYKFKLLPFEVKNILFLSENNTYPYKFKTGKHYYEKSEIFL